MMCVCMPSCVYTVSVSVCVCVQVYDMCVCLHSVCVYICESVGCEDQRTALVWFLPSTLFEIGFLAFLLHVLD